MSSQVFCIKPDIESLKMFINTFCILQNDKHIYNKYVFKKANYQTKIKEFCECFIKFYYDSKKFYIKRNHTYKTFATVLRQLCKYYNISFESKIKYVKSKHEMEYYIGI